MATGRDEDDALNELPGESGDARDVSWPRTSADPALLDDVVAANRILAAHGVLDAFGHVSARHPSDPEKFILARNIAPALVGREDLLVFDLDGEVVGPNEHHVYVERFIHGEIYRSRSDVNAVVHCHSFSLIPFGVTAVPLRPICHMSGFLRRGVPVFDIRNVAGATNMLISSRGLGAALAHCLGGHAATLMRGHGATIVGDCIPHAVFRAIYLEINARLQGEAMKLGDVTYLSDEEASLAAAANDRQVLRPWHLWKLRALGNPD